MGKNGWIRWILTIYFILFVVFLYGPMFVMFVLSFQGPQGGMTFPMKGFSLHWWERLFSQEFAAFREATARSFWLGLLTAAITSLFSTLLALAFRRRFTGSTAVFYFVLLGIMCPGILLGLGLSLLWSFFGWSTGLYTTALGAHVVWSLPFGFLVMIAALNRFDPGIEEASRDLGASDLRTFVEILLPLIWVGIFGAALFGFTLSWNEFSRTVLLASQNTLPLQIFSQATVRVISPALYALGTFSTIITLLLILVYFFVAGYLETRNPSN